MNKEPKVIQYFCEDTLVKQPVYKAEKPYIPLYINEHLFPKYFNCAFSREKACQILSDFFSITLSGNENNRIGEAFVDKQKDPLGVSMNGNRGSGRAFFYDENFNIKGDKTILATSDDAEFNNGQLSLPMALNECVISNILAHDLSFSPFQTLAVLYKNASFDFPNWRLEQEGFVLEFISKPCALIIRVYQDKEFYRFSNAYEDGYCFSEKEIAEISRRLGILEGEKFIYRFLHGSWSAGNMSTACNIIDFDTSCFVKGRHPQYSITPNYKSNYFGYETEGQKLLLSPITNDFSSLEKACSDTILRGVCDLIGLDFDLHYSKYKEEITSLASAFNKLSRKMHTDAMNVCVSFSENDSEFYFDFSKLFSTYLSQKLSNTKPYIALLGSLNLKEKPTWVKEEVSQKLKEFFQQDIAGNEDDLLIEITQFMLMYDKLLDKVIQNENVLEVLLKSYIVNEDRTLLFGYQAVFEHLSRDYISGDYTDGDIHLIVSTLIKAYKRKFSKKEEHLTNLRIYKDCLTYISIKDNTYQFVTVPYADSGIKTAAIIYNDNLIPLKKSIKNGYKIFKSENFNLDIEFYCKQKSIELMFNGFLYTKRSIDKPY